MVFRYSCMLFLMFMMVFMLMMGFFGGCGCVFLRCWLDGVVVLVGVVEFVELVVYVFNSSRLVMGVVVSVL